MRSRHPAGVLPRVLPVCGVCCCSPLANVLAEEFHADFEESVRRMMNMQQRRPLAGDELINRNKFVKKDGTKVRWNG